MIQKIEYIHSYASKPFDILCEVDPCISYELYKMTVINNLTKEPVEVVEKIERDQLETVREELIFKWLINLGV
jgi:hypothetical protein